MRHLCRWYRIPQFRIQWPRDNWKQMVHHFSFHFSCVFNYEVEQRTRVVSSEGLSNGCLSNATSQLDPNRRFDIYSAVQNNSRTYCVVHIWVTFCPCSLLFCSFGPPGASFMVYGVSSPWRTWLKRTIWFIIIAACHKYSFPYFRQGAHSVQHAHIINIKYSVVFLSQVQRTQYLKFSIPQLQWGNYSCFRWLNIQSTVWWKQ